MKLKALVIQDSPGQEFDYDHFMMARNLYVEYCATGECALTALKSTQYRCVLVSLDMEREDPLGIIDALRSAEMALGLSPTQIVVAGKKRQLTQIEITKLNISGHIRVHQMS